MTAPVSLLFHFLSFFVCDLAAKRGLMSFGVFFFWGGGDDGGRSEPGSNVVLLQIGLGLKTSVLSVPVSSRTQRHFDSVLFLIKTG